MSLILLCFIACQLFFHESVAIPVEFQPVKVVDSSSSPEYVGFVSDPNGRGTASLLINCLLTLVLCVWSALHLNVPRRANGTFNSFFCNLRWIVAGIYAPELVVFTAWRQWASAKILGNLVEKHYSTSKAPAADSSIPVGDAESGSAQPGPSFTLRYKWTKTHDFFACTGGFAFEIDNYKADKIQDTANDFLPLACPTRLTLTARGMALLAECGHLPDIPEEIILDKSKATGLAKALVLIQASWMLLQTLGRLAAKLPVTLLEINTIAHVGCVFVMYLLWWNKPLLPSEPIILKGDWVEPLCAYMYMSSEMSGTEENRKSHTWVKTIFATLNWFSRIPEVEHICLLMQRPVIDDDTNVQGTNDRYLPGHIRQAPDSCLSELKARRLEKAANTAFFERRPRVGVTKELPSPTSAITQQRWNLAKIAIDLYPSIRQSHTLYAHDTAYTNIGTPTEQCIHLNPAQLVVPTVQNWPSDDLLRNVSGLLVGIMLWSLNFLYGALHATAWTSHFPSDAEMWLWRVSALYIAFCGGLWIILNYVALLYPPLNAFWERWMDGVSSPVYLAVIGTAVFVCGLSFCLTRGFLLVEAFISIRSLEPGVYETPDWTQIFPHF